MTKELEDTELEDADTLPSYENLFREVGLYQEFDLVGDWSYVKRFFQGPDLQFDAHCVFCEKEATFKQYVGPRGAGSGSSLPKNEIYLEPRIVHLEFRCQREDDHRYYYVLQVHRQAIQKIGQSPSLATIAAAGVTRFKRVLAKNYLADLNRAIGLFAHGIGAGSFVYLRRIFEHLLLETVGKARSSGDALAGFETLHMDKKIEALSAYLPREVVEAAGVYSVLSAGIHALSEEECLGLFPVMLASIEFILDGHLEAKKREEHRHTLKNALVDAKKAVKAAANKAVK